MSETAYTSCAGSPSAPFAIRTRAIRALDARLGETAAFTSTRTEWCSDVFPVVVTTISSKGLAKGVKPMLHDRGEAGPSD